MDRLEGLREAASRDEVEYPPPGHNFEPSNIRASQDEIYLEEDGNIIIGNMNHYWPEHSREGTPQPLQIVQVVDEPLLHQEALSDPRYLSRVMETWQRLNGQPVGTDPALLEAAAISQAKTDPNRAMAARVDTALFLVVISQLLCWVHTD